MATWQADFHLVFPNGLPIDYRQILGRLLPPAQSWSDEIETWGTDDSDRFDAVVGDERPAEIFVRFDLRRWQPDLYARFVAMARAWGGELRSAKDGARVPLDIDAFEHVLRSSAAAEFVKGPYEFVSKLATRFEFRIHDPGPRPPYTSVAEHLWGNGVDFDSDGNSRTLDDRNWTELTVTRRGPDAERVDIDPVSDRPLVLQVVSGSRELAFRAARFLADATGGDLEEKP